MASHTPGPWIAIENDGYIHEEKEKSHVAIKTTYEMPWHIARIPSCAPNKLANAHLIAAAPELLDALKEFAAQHACGCKHPACKSCDRDRMADEAIAKAEGRGS